MSIRIKFVSLSIWQWDGAIIRGSWDAYRAWAQKSSNAEPSVFDDGGEAPAGHAWVQAGRPWLLWTETADPAVLAHEALHVTAGVLGARGLSFTPESEEAYTYTMMAIMAEAISAKGWVTVGKQKRTMR